MARDHSSRPRFRPVTDRLESRTVMTGGAGSVFADIPATISAAGASVAVPFTVDPAHFKATHGSMTLGIDVSGQGTNAATPRIVSVLDANGHPLALRHSTYPAAVSKLLDGKTVSSAVTVNLNLSGLRHGKAGHFTVEVASQGQTTGGVGVSFFLPGDADGDGAVTSQDIQTIQADQKLVAGNTRYVLAADANRDGQIDRTDLTIARRNLGVSTTVSPTLSGAPDPADAVDSKTLMTSVQALGFAGTATPGATLTATAITGQAPPATTTAGADGKYRLVLNLTPGANAFTITESDAFGQINTGVLPQILYTPKAS